MKVAFLSFKQSGRGGTETVLTEVINALNKQNTIARLFLVEGSDDEEWLKYLSVTKIDEYHGNKIFKYMTYFFRLSTLLRKFKPDVIIGLDDRCVFLAKKISRLFFLRTKVASWVHFSLDTIKWNRLDYADFHLAISSGIKQQLLAYKIADASNIHLIYNPVKPAAIIKRATSKIPHFVYVGRLQYDGQKRVNLLLQALSKLNGKWQLSVLGDGGDRGRLKMLAETLRINQNIIWYGWKSNPWDELQEASALILTSAFEGFPMILGEAMARGIPCISSDCPTGPKDIIKNTVNGWLYPPEDLNCLITILQQIIDDSTVLPDTKEVCGSIEHLYTEAYIAHLLKALEREILQ